MQLAGVEAVGVARLREELLGPRRVVRVGLERQRELEGPRDVVARGLGRAQRLRVAQGLTIDGVVGGQSHPPVVPRGFRIPLIEEVQVEDGDAAGEGQLEVGITLDLLRLGDVAEVGNVDLAPLQHGEPRGALRHALVDQPLHRGDLPPVALVGLHHELDTGSVAHELVGPEPHGGILEAVVPHALDVFLGHDPAGSRHHGAVEGHEVRPGLVQDEAYARGADDDHLADLVAEKLGALGAMEAELVDALVGADRPGFGQAGAHQIAGHGFHERVVNRVEDPEGSELARHLGRIEPDGRQRHVEGPAHLAFRLRLGRGGASEGAHEQGADERDGRGEIAWSNHAVIAMRPPPPPNARDRGTLSRGPRLGEAPTWFARAPRLRMTAARPRPSPG